MQFSDRDYAALWDMVQAIRLIQEFIAPLSYEDYLDSRRDQMAVERGLEILGEAARRVSESFQQAHPEIDWRNTIGLRNVIIHRYEQVQQDRIWAIVTVELIHLLAQLEALLPDEI
ncbi:HepT-like ribonuclease domain-containing protein [Leptolyngbya sp. AN03gr2]|uniref:HepT-like ribonuclease domain-containing protein n=1 Tax=unclassified Leptolyngbya TaxID=2650499 RepID=UPI003D311C6F